MLFVIFCKLPGLVRTAASCSVGSAGETIFTVVAFALLFKTCVSRIFQTTCRTIPGNRCRTNIDVNLAPFRAFYRILFPRTTLVTLPGFNGSIVGLLGRNTLTCAVKLVSLVNGKGLVVTRGFKTCDVRVCLTYVVVC